MNANYKEVEVTKFESMLDGLSTSGLLDLSRYELLIYGGGGQSRSFYNTLCRDSDFKILWTGWCGPAWMSFLSFIPGQAGLVNVLKPNRLKHLFEDLATVSVSDLYYVPKNLTPMIQNAVSKHPASNDPMKILKNETDFFYLQIEMEQTFITNGRECFLFDIVIGPTLANDLKVLLSTAWN